MTAMIAATATVTENTILPTEDHGSVVTALVFNQVIPSVLRLCLEYGVHNRGVDPYKRNYVRKVDATIEWDKKVDETIRDFVQDEEMDRPHGWFAKNSSYYRKTYMELDTTSLIEIIPKVTDIKHNSKSKSFIQLFNSLKELKHLRNKVIHEKQIAFSVDNISLISENMSTILDQLGHLFDISENEVDMLKSQHQKEIKDICFIDDQKTSVSKIIFQIQKSLVREFSEQCSEMFVKPMKSITLPCNVGQVSLSDIFHETDLDVISDPNKSDSLNPRERKTFPCTDIFSRKHVSIIDIIEGDPGSGKSTFLKKVCLEFCKKNENNVDLQFKSISSYEMMFHFNCHETLNINSFWDFLKTMFRATTENFSEYCVIRALRDLKTIIAIDGIDECNQASEELVKDIIRKLSDADKVKFLFTTRPGYSKMIIKEFDSQAATPRLLNIKPIQDIKEQEIFITRVIEQLPKINGKETLKAYKDQQAELRSILVRPIDLILFITLFHCCSDEIKVSQKTDLMQLTFNMLSKNISVKLPQVDKYKQRASMIMKMTGRYSLQWIQNKTYEVDEEIFNEISYEVFNKLNFANDGVDEVSVDSLLMCVFQQQQCAARNITTYSFFHHSLQEYLASKIFTEKLVDRRVETVLEILEDLIGQVVQKEDLNRSVRGKKI